MKLCAECAHRQEEHVDGEWECLHGACGCVVFEPIEADQDAEGIVEKMDAPRAESEGESEDYPDAEGITYA